MVQLTPGAVLALRRGIRLPAPLYVKARCTPLAVHTVAVHMPVSCTRCALRVVSIFEGFAASAMAALGRAVSDAPTRICVVSRVPIPQVSQLVNRGGEALWRCVHATTPPSRHLCSELTSINSFSLLALPRTTPAQPPAALHHTATELHHRT
jgi:hypothetical protein